MGDANAVNPIYKEIPPPPTSGPMPDPRNQAILNALADRSSGWFHYFFKEAWAFVLPGLMMTAKIFASSLDDILTGATQIFTALQGIDSPGFFGLVAANIGDLLGVEVNPEAFANAFRKGGDTAGMKAVGGVLFDQLTKEFATGTVLSPEQGIGAAKAFLGFLMAFSVREGNLAFFGQILPEQFRFFEGIRDYGIDLARNLGLGRLSRRALTPLIQTLIADPMQWSLNNTYRPKLLSYDIALRSWLRGGMDKREAQRIMAWQGYADSTFDQLTADLVERPAATDIFEVFKHGTLSEDDAIAAMQQRGTTRELARQFFAALDYREADTYVTEEITALRTALAKGLMDRPSVEAAIAGLPLGIETKARLSRLLNLEIRTRQRQLSFSQMEKAYIAGIIDLSELEDWARTSGYDEDEQNILLYLTLVSLDTDQARQATVRYKYNLAVLRAKKKKQAPPPPPPGLILP